MTSHDVTLVSGNGTRAAPEAVFEARHLIDGRFVDSAGGETFTRHSPANGKLVTRAALWWRSRDRGGHRCRADYL